MEGRMARDRRYNLVIYGATGYTGRLAASYLASRLSALPCDFSWAVAGRRKDSLREVAAAVAPSGRKPAGKEGKRAGGLVSSEALDAALGASNAGNTQGSETADRLRARATRELTRASTSTVNGSEVGAGARTGASAANGAFQSTALEGASTSGDVVDADDDDLSTAQGSPDQRAERESRPDIIVVRGDATIKSVSEKDGQGNAVEKAVGKAGEKTAEVQEDVIECTLEELASMTHVLVSCVGPYTVAGEAVVAACVAAECHYIDITAELPWVAQMHRKYDKEAKQKGIKMVVCCGYDFVPNDMGLFQLHTILTDPNSTSNSNDDDEGCKDCFRDCVRDCAVDDASADTPTLLRQTLHPLSSASSPSSGFIVTQKLSGGFEGQKVKWATHARSVVHCFKQSTPMVSGGTALSGMHLFQTIGWRNIINYYLDPYAMNNQNQFAMVKRSGSTETETDAGNEAEASVSATASASVSAVASASAEAKAEAQAFTPTSKNARTINAYGNLLPRYVPELQAYCTPFVMSSLMQKYVNWSNELQHGIYNKNLIYRGGEKHESVFRALFYSIFIWFQILGVTILSLLPSLYYLLPTPGSGCPIDSEASFMECELVAQVPWEKCAEDVLSNEPCKTVVITWRLKGGEAYFAAALFSIEAALTLNYDSGLPRNCGVLTPAAALGRPYLDRLLSNPRLQIDVKSKNPKLLCHDASCLHHSLNKHLKREHALRA